MQLLFYAEIVIEEVPTKNIENYILTRAHWLRCMEEIR